MMHNRLKIMCWNVRGVMSSALCLSNILNLYKPDIMVICEHKLSSQNLAFLNTLHSEYTAFPFTDMDTTNTVSVLVKQQLMFSVSLLKECCNDRIVLVELTASTFHKVYICAVYLPYDNDVDLYKQYMQQLYDIMNIYTEKGIIILAGDFNARAFENPHSYSQKLKSRILTDFVDFHNLELINKSQLNHSIPYTFVPTKSTIDYIMIDKQHLDLILSYETIVNSDIDIASDHLLLFCTLSIPLYR